MSVAHLKKLAKSIRKEYLRDIWTNCFYLDPKSKQRGKNWWGSKVGSSMKNAYFMVAITYQKGVWICEQFEKMNRANFVGFIPWNFKSIFQNCINQNIFLIYSRWCP